MDAPVEIATARNAAELSGFMAIPLFVAAYSFQFGTFSDIASGSPLSPASLIFGLLQDCGYVMVTALIVGCLFMYAAAWLGETTGAPVFVISGSILLSIAFTCLAAIHAVSAKLPINQFWFFAAGAVGILLIHMEVKGRAQPGAQADGPASGGPAA